MDTTDLFKSLIFDALVKAALEKLFLAVPLLGWGPIGWIVTIIVEKYAGQLYDMIALYIHVESIVIKTQEFREAYESASTRLRSVGKEKGITSPEFLEARRVDREALSKFVRPVIAA